MRVAEARASSAKPVRALAARELRAGAMFEWDLPENRMKGRREERRGVGGKKPVLASKKNALPALERRLTEVLFD